MSHYRRPKFCGGYYFFTVVTYERRKILTGELARKHLRHAFEKVRLKRHFETTAICLLPDHLHCVWTLPEGDRDFPTRWRLIKSRFSRGLPTGPLRPSHGVRQERGIWQRRYWEHHIRDEADYAAHVRYCQMNPVKHGMTPKAENYPFCSYRWFIENAESEFRKLVEKQPVDRLLDYDRI